VLCRRLIESQLARPGRNQLKETHAMLSFRNLSFIAAAALAAAIGILVYDHDTTNAAAGGLTLARPSAMHVSFPRASTRADELAGINHEGF
jgi:hypothetical protein